MSFDLGSGSILLNVLAALTARPICLIFSKIPTLQA